MVQGYVKPTNQIIMDVEGLVTHEYTVGAAATPAKMLPGTAVIYDSVDYAVKEAGAEADNFLGILDVAAGKLRTTAYAVGDQVRVIERGKCLARVPAGGTAITPGMPLVTAADGLLEAQAVGLIGDQGAPAAYALESDTHVAESLVLVELTGQREAA